MYNMSAASLAALPAFVVTIVRVRRRERITIMAKVEQQQGDLLVGIRAASHAEATCPYDRVVFEFDEKVPDTLSARYVSKLVSCGSGLQIPVNGQSILELRFSPTRAHTDTGTPTVPDRVSFNLSIVNEVVSSCDFEGIVTYGIGISRQAMFNFSTLVNPPRVVIDFLY